MYCITLRNKFDKTIIGWYDASASNFSTDQRRAKHFFSRVDADLIADQLRRMYPRLAQDIEVTAVQHTGLTCSSDRRTAYPGGRKRYRRGRPLGSRRSDHSNTARSEKSGRSETRASASCIARDRGFESAFLQQPVCLSSEP